MDGKEGAEAATRLTGHLLFFTSPFFVFFCLSPRRLCLLFRCAQCLPAKEIAAVDQVSATFECKLLGEDFGGETVYCKACEGKLQSLSCKLKDFLV